MGVNMEVLFTLTNYAKVSSSWIKEINMTDEILAPAW